MKSFIVYKKDTGEIIRSGSCQDIDILLQQGTDEFVLEGRGNNRTHYISDGSVEEKIASTAVLSTQEVQADSIDSITLSGYPANTKITVQGPIQYTGALDPVQDTITFAYPGRYKIRFFCVEQLEKELIVHAY